MRFWKFLLVFLAFFTLLFNNVLFAKTEYKPIKVFFEDGTKYNTKLVVIDGAGYLKANDVAKYYSADLNYRGVSSSIELKFADGSIVFFDGKQDVLVNGVKQNLNKAACIIGKEFYIPLAVLLNSIFEDFVKCETFWDYDTGILKIINTGKAKENVALKSEKNTIKENKAAVNEKNTVGFVSAQSVVKPLQETKAIKKPINLIVIDAGHGDQDPGAVAKNGIKEKDINLSVAKKLAEILVRDYGKKVILTRQEDVFVPLRERGNIANKNNADMFISIHSNAAPSVTSRKGFEVYFLSENGSDKEADEVARLENAAENFEKNADTDINTILWSMVINEYMNESSEFAYFVTENVRETFPDYKINGVKQAGFRVLRGAKMPAVLVELGYMTNFSDLVMLCKEEFQLKMAALIAKSVIDYEDNRQQ